MAKYKISSPHEFMKAIGFIAEMLPSLPDDPALRHDLSKLEPISNRTVGGKSVSSSSKKQLTRKTRWQKRFEKLVADIKRRGPEIFIANLDAEHLQLLERAGLKDDIENAPEFLAFLVERQWHLEVWEEDYRRRSERREIIVGGTLKQFEAFVKYLKYEWCTDRRASLILTGPQQPKDLPWLEWSVYKRDDCDDSKAGAIMAMELPQTRIKTIFQMFGFPDRDLFWQEVDQFKRRMKQWGFTEVQPTPDEAKVGNEETAVPVWLPTTDTPRRRWQRAYSIMVDLERIYREEYKDCDREHPDPKIGDYRDALADKMGWKPCDKTTGRIKKAGDSGWLE